MKQVTNLIKVWVMFLLAMTWNACTEDVDFAPASPVDGEQVYFANTQPVRIDISKDASSFAVKLNRMNTAADATVGIKVLKKSDKLTVPGSVTFKAGESVANLVVSYNPQEMEYDQYETLSLQIDDETCTTPYGDTSFTLTVGIPAPYTTIGEGIYRDAFLCSGYGYESLPYLVEIQKNDVREGIYRLVEPYGKRFPYYAAGMADTSQPYHLVIDASDPDCVYIPFQCLGFQMGAEGIAYGYSVAGYWLDNGKTKEEVKAVGYGGTLKDGVITFPAETLILNFSGDPADNQQFYTGNIYGEFILTLPGVELTDYSINLTYKGFMIDAINRPYALADLELGEDVETARLAIVEATGAADDVEQAVQGIIDGSVKSTVVEASGEVKLPCKKGGVFYLVGVSYKGEEAKEAAYVKFKTAGSGDEDEVTPIEAYEGLYVIEGTYTDENEVEKRIQLPLSLQKGVFEDSEGQYPAIIVNGLAGFNGYETMVPLIYDEFTGKLSMSQIVLDPFSSEEMGITADVVFSPVVAADGQMFTSKDALTGALDENGDLVFTNGMNNQHQYDSFVFVILLDYPTLFSPFYELTLTPDGGSAATRSAWSMTDGFTGTRLNGTVNPSIRLKKIGGKSAKPITFDFPVKNCGENSKSLVRMNLGAF